jgi:formylglycine-generating enzyme required for sulfatase activity
MVDQLVDGSWPKFLHPLPLSNKYFLVSCRPGPDAAWGLFDMHGNVAEWTASAEMPYPFRGDDPRHAATDARRIVRGGSWRQRADLARSGCRLSYQRWQRVFDVGFRVACPAE